MSTPPTFHPVAEAFSRFLCWSASFYPQPILNWRRRSTAGLAIDFWTINILGFVSYLISTASFLYSPLIRDQYAARNPQAPKPTVRFNDFAFAAHAVIMSIFVYTQFWCWGFKRERSQRVSWPIMGIFWGAIAGVLVIVALVMTRGRDGGRDAFGWAWIDVIYAVGYVKLLITVVKYVPQAWTNYRRQSTVGWSIDQILLDSAGGVLSIMQLALDSSLQGDWTGVTGNPVKFGLGNVSVFFDVVFILQHYVLYRRARIGGKMLEEIDDEEENTHTPLLRSV
ncbi:MAG: hypothetical protein M1816_005122 [Peltula sp. TS41687]|nr:MAG: hypothetical protein M1816_005122 [Peltula sp. TS41687]